MTDHDGRRLAAIRARKNLTQRGLADRAHVSISLLTKVESGARVATPAFLAACARALGVDTATITNEFAQETGSSDPVMERVRSALDLLDTDPDQSIQARALSALRTDVHQINRSAQAAQYRQVAADLPALLGEVHAAATNAKDSDRVEFYALLAETARVGHTVAIGLGHADVSPLALSRVDQAASIAGINSPGWRAIRDYLRITTALRIKDYEGCWRLHASALRHLEGTTLSDPGILIARGQLNLGAAVIAAKTGNTDESQNYLAEADRLAAITGESDLSRFWVGFGPTNVRTHRALFKTKLFGLKCWGH